MKVDSVAISWIGLILAIIALAQRFGNWTSARFANALAWLGGLLAIAWCFIFWMPLAGWIAAGIYWHVILWFAIPAVRGISFTPLKQPK